MSQLRKATIELAHQKPELRPHLLPLLTKEAQDDGPKAWIKIMFDAEGDLDRAVEILNRLPQSKVFKAGNYRDSWIFQEEAWQEPWNLVLEFIGDKSVEDARSFVSEYRRKLPGKMSRPSLKPLEP
jgi:hypothetical protein